VFSSFHTLKYHARTAAGVPALLQAVQTFCSTAARDDPRGLTVSIKGYAVQDLKRWGLTNLVFEGHILPAVVQLVKQ
jgi:hypothetical protein